MSLEKELETYRRRLPELLASEGQYVLIKGKKVLGIFRKEESALNAGYDRLGARVSFLVKKIQAVEEIIRLPFDYRIFQNAAHQTANRRKRRHR